MQFSFCLFIQDSGGGLVGPSPSNKPNSTDIAHEEVRRTATKKREGSPASVTTPTSSVQVDDMQLAIKQVLVFHLGYVSSSVGEGLL